MQEPAAQRYLASTAEPTRLDVSAGAAAARPQVWFLRYRGPDGAWRKVRYTTAQVLGRLRKGTVPAGLEACREDQSDFRPLADFPEFRALARRQPRQAKPKPRRRAPAPAARKVAPARRPLRWIIAAAGLLVLALAALLLLLLPSS